MPEESTIPVTKEEKAKAAKAWAEFLLSEYLREKALPGSTNEETMKEPTIHHDKPTN